MIGIELYNTDTGRCPVLVYLSLERNMGQILPEYFNFFVGNKSVLTNGFTKKTQKVPKADIEMAKKYKADYERRHYHE